MDHHEIHQLMITTSAEQKSFWTLREELSSGHKAPSCTSFDGFNACPAQGEYFQIFSSTIQKLS
jgi:hypothetical protein